MDGKQRERLVKALKRIHASVLETLRNTRLRREDKEGLLLLAGEILDLLLEVGRDEAPGASHEKSFWEIIRKLFRFFKR